MILIFSLCNEINLCVRQWLLVSIIIENLYHNIVSLALCALWNLLRAMFKCTVHNSQRVVFTCTVHYSQRVMFMRTVHYRQRVMFMRTVHYSQRAMFMRTVHYSQRATNKTLRVFTDSSAIFMNEVKWWSSSGRTDLSIHFQPSRPKTSECFSYPYAVS